MEDVIIGTRSLLFVHTFTKIASQCAAKHSARKLLPVPHYGFQVRVRFGSSDYLAVPIES